MIRTRGLGRRYGERRGIEGVDLELESGEVFGFLGPNGAGKTTTIRLLLGFLRPTAGEARVLGLDCWRESHRIKRELGYLPGDLRLHAWMSVETALAVVGRVRGRDLRREGGALAERLGLPRDVRARAMSRGMRQKLGIVLALAHRPRVLVFDEPTSGLDPLVQDELARLLRERASEGTTVFFSSHTLSEVEAICDRVAIVRAGEIAADASLGELRRRARRRVTLRFVDAAAAEVEPPPGLSVVERRGNVWEGELEGEAGALGGWLAEQRIEDFVVGAPGLEALFRAYYRVGAEPAP